MSRKEKHAAGARRAAPVAFGGRAAGRRSPGARLPKMKRKPYEREMRVLHGELDARPVVPAAVEDH